MLFTFVATFAILCVAVSARLAFLAARLFLATSRTSLLCTGSLCTSSRSLVAALRFITSSRFLAAFLLALFLALTLLSTVLHTLTLSAEHWFLAAF